ncbi:PTS system, mannose-specific IIA component [Desulfocicer vacuolatum DSM 3385]|uniref:PTS system, mannose-specific IIA component n=1 Tax=Desulfocicer vacuolatum DSM 3385 TaxID=1121400 RepID=A0A1W2CEL4_9BACT|nr:PTS system, mannose-specific IIA component [Desulfocicer vacuolatum DSM 3385]
MITHAQLGQSLIDTLEFIMDMKYENLAAVSIDIKENPDTLLKKIKNAIKKVRHGQGVIIFTDMFGGTPSNLSYSFLEEDKVEVMSGVNLPILMKAMEIREKAPLKETVQNLVEYGKRSISQASAILKGEENRQQ